MRRSTRGAAVVLGVSALLVPALASPAAAHVTANPDTAESPYHRTALRIGHGCEGSPTVEVRVQIPEGVENPRAEVVTGWDVEVVREELDEPVVDSHGEEVTERVAEIAWVGGSLSDDQFQEFGLNFRILDDAPEVLWFPTIQRCEEGEHRWIDIPPSVAEWGDFDEPAPYVINAVGAADDGAEPAADTEEVAEPADDEAAASGADDGTDPLVWVALAAGLLGLVAGAGAFGYARRRATGQST